MQMDERSKVALKQMLIRTKEYTGQSFNDEQVDSFVENYGNAIENETQRESYEAVREAVKRSLTIDTDYAKYLKNFFSAEVEENAQYEQSLMDTANMSTSDKISTDFWGSKKRDAQKELDTIKAQKEKISMATTYKMDTFTLLYNYEKRGISFFVGSKENMEDAKVLYEKLPQELKVLEECKKMRDEGDLKGLMRAYDYHIGMDLDSELPILKDETFGLNQQELEEYRANISKRLKSSHPLSRIMMRGLAKKGDLSFRDVDKNIWGSATEESYYRNAIKGVTLNGHEDFRNVCGSGHTFFHELSHAIDHQIPTVNSSAHTTYTRAEANTIADYLDEFTSDAHYNEVSADEFRQWEKTDIEKVRAVWQTIREKRNEKEVPDDEWIYNVLSVANIIADYSQIRGLLHQEGYISYQERNKETFASKLKTDFDKYVTNYVIPTYFLDQIKDKAMQQKAVAMAIKKRLENMIMMRARYCYENGLDMDKYGGGMEGAAQLTSKTFEELTSRSLEEQVQWLRKSDPLNRDNGKAYLHTSGIQDIFRSFVQEPKENLTKDEIAIREHLKNMLDYGHDDPYWGDAEKAKRNRNAEAFAEMNEVEMGGNPVDMLYYMEYMPESFAYFKKMRRVAIQRM